MNDNVPLTEIEKQIAFHSYSVRNGFKPGTVQASIDLQQAAIVEFLHPEIIGNAETGTISEAPSRMECAVTCIIAAALLALLAITLLRSCGA